MKNIKLLAFTLVVTLFSLTSFSQEKLENRANEMVKEMAAKFASSETLKLTPEQEKALKEIYLKKITEVKAVKAEVTEEVAQKEKVKEVNKKYGKLIAETVLTKEQKAFLKESKKE